jgi:hypothetical protein
MHSCALTLLCIHPCVHLVVTESTALLGVLNFLHCSGLNSTAALTTAAAAADTVTTQISAYSSSISNSSSSSAVAKPFIQLAECGMYTGPPLQIAPGVQPLEVR